MRDTTAEAGRGAETAKPGLSRACPRAYTHCPMRLALFDIDGTLMQAGGAGMRAFVRAIGEVFDVTVDRKAINPDGKTDPLIAREFLAHCGEEHRLNEVSGAALFSAYLIALEDEMERARAAGSVRVLPGVVELLEALSSSPEFALGLVTGNLERGAVIKLSKAGLDGYFHFGGFGSDSADRTGLIREGIGRGARHVAPRPVEAAFVFGDTPLDVSHGRAAGATVIAVASGRYSRAELDACNPDLVLPDLTAVGPILSFLREGLPGSLR